MSTLLIFWISISIIFLIVEMVSVTFYGLALAVAAAATALYVWLTGATTVDVMQGVIFVTMSLLASYFLPKLLTSSTPDKPQGLDIYIGETRKVKKVWDSYKISLDGVDYLIRHDDDLEVGDTVEVIGHQGSSIKVQKV